MGKKKTHEEYVNEIVNFNIEVVGVYNNARTPILHRCKKCGHQWNISPDNVLHGYGCPKCAGVMKYTTDDFIHALFKINDKIRVIGEYINANTKVKCRCLIDGCEWEAIPRILLKGHGCPLCAGNKKKTHDEYVNNVMMINPDIEVVGEYVSADDSILHRCKNDGFEWFAKPNNILSGKGCPKCCSSKGERFVATYLKNNNIRFEEQYTFAECKNIKLLPFDFYIPDYNTCIEYDGIQHFEPRDYFGGQSAFEKTVKHDAIKSNYCLLNNIKLIRIKYDDNIVKVLDRYFCNTKLIKEVV